MLSQTCINFFLVLNTKEDILKNVGNQKFAGPHWIWSHWWPEAVWFPTFFKITYVQQNKEMHSGLKQLESE